MDNMRNGDDQEVDESISFALYRVPLVVSVQV